MKFCPRFQDDGIAVIAVSGALVRSSALHDLLNISDQMKKKGRSGQIFDLSGVTRINMAGTAALVEFISRSSTVDIVLCSLPKCAKRTLETSGLDRGLRLFENADAALNAPELMPHSLCKTQAIILGISRGDFQPGILPGALDVLGRPAAHRVADFLARFGIRNTTLLLAGNDSGLMEHFYRWQGEAHGVFAVRDENSEREPEFLANAGRNFGFDYGETIVVQADVLADLDLTKLLRQHRAANVDVTCMTHALSLHNRVESNPTQPCGVYIFNPGTFSELTANSVWQSELASALPLTNLRTQYCSADRDTFRLGGAMQYAQAIEACLQGWVPNMTPDGEQVSPFLWCGEKANISRFARINGPCFVGARAEVGRHSRLSGFNIVGARASVASGCELMNTLLLPGVRLDSKRRAKNEILFFNGAIDWREERSGSEEYLVETTQAA